MRTILFYLPGDIKRYLHRDWFFSSIFLHYASFFCVCYSEVQKKEFSSIKKICIVTMKKKPESLYQNHKVLLTWRFVTGLINIPNTPYCKVMTIIVYYFLNSIGCRIMGTRNSTFLFIMFYQFLRRPE